jgi:hypothetical protein
MVFVWKIFHSPWQAEPKSYNAFSQRTMITPIDFENLEHTCVAHSDFLRNISPWNSIWNGDSSVAYVLGYRLESRCIRVRFLTRKETFLSSKISRPALGPIQPPNHWVSEAISLGVKQPEREAHHSTPTSTEVKKTLIYTSTPPYVLLA